MSLIGARLDLGSRKTHRVTVYYNNELGAFNPIVVPAEAELGDVVEVNFVHSFDPSTNTTNTITIPIACSRKGE